MYIIMSSSEIASKNTTIITNNEKAYAEKKPNSQHFMLSSFINTNSSFTQFISIPFNPSIMKMNYSYYFDNDAEAGVSLVRCFGLIEDPQAILCPLKDGQVFRKSEFRISKPVNGNYTFDIVTLAGFADTTRTGDLVVDLEFIE